MPDVDGFIDDFLQHDYDPVKAREYYLRTRKLKGRKKGITNQVAPPTSPSGSKMLRLDPKIGAVYEDGSVFGETGWQRGKLNSRKTRQIAAQAKIEELKKIISKLPPEKRAAVEKKLHAVEKKLHALAPGTKKAAPVKAVANKPVTPHKPVTPRKHIPKKTPVAKKTIRKAPPKAPAASPGRMRAI